MPASSHGLVVSSSSLAKGVPAPNRRAAPNAAMIPRCRQLSMRSTPATWASEARPLSLRPPVPARRLQLEQRGEAATACDEVGRGAVLDDAAVVDDDDAVRFP